MNINNALKLVVEPGLSLLPSNMDTPEARVMLLMIGLQESRFKHRRQIGGPAHGFYQFEKNGGVAGVMNHRSTKPIIDPILDSLEINKTKLEVYQAIVYNDALATIMARLLLWTVPRPMPDIDSDPQLSWQYYIDAWRPGRPHRETWDSFRTHSVNGVTIHES